IARAVLPALAAWGAAALVPSSSEALRLCVAGAVALAVAAWGVRRDAVRIAQLREWARRVRTGERVSPPLREGASDALDDLVSDLGGMAETLGEGLTRLENERDRLEAILAAMVEGVIVIDRHGAILRANARVAETFGVGAHRPLAGLR